MNVYAIESRLATLVYLNILSCDLLSVVTSPLQDLDRNAGYSSLREKLTDVDVKFLWIFV